MLDLIPTNAYHPFVPQNNVFFNVLAAKHIKEKKYNGKLIQSGTLQILIMDLKGNRMERCFACAHINRNACFIY